jgi:predicted ATPase
MIVQELVFEDKINKWSIGPITFGRLTLLVGASGVGKTRILKALRLLKSISNGKSLNGVSWSVKFQIGNANYTWAGEFETDENRLVTIVEKTSSDDNERDKNEKKPALLSEKLIVNNKEIAFRDTKNFVFRGDKLPITLKSEQSFTSLLEDDDVKTVVEEFNKLIYSDYSDAAKGYKAGIDVIDDSFLSKYKDIEQIRQSDENLTSKFYWVSKKDDTVFSRIEETYKAVFPQVEQLRIAPLPDFQKASGLPSIIKALPFIQLRESGVDRWIPVMEMSAGMYRTLKHIMEIYLSAEGTVILIDEFENSLGVNCIDEITDEIKEASDRIQFIITSHHPYIINNIKPTNWKLVTREGSKVYAEDVSKFGFNKSKHQAFMQLINLPEYKTGKRTL